jgi:putative endopeptidase
MARRTTSTPSSTPPPTRGRTSTRSRSGSGSRTIPSRPTSARGASRDVVQEETYRRLIDINEEAARSHAPAGSNAQKLGDFWAAAMDSERGAKQGYAPLAAEFARIDSVQDLDGLLATIAHLKHMGVGGLMAMPIYQDEKNSARFTLPPLPGRARPAEPRLLRRHRRQAVGLRREYENHVARMFTLLGRRHDARRTAPAPVLALETELAARLAQARGPARPDRQLPRRCARRRREAAPSIRWKRVPRRRVASRGVDTVVVGQPEFFRQVEKSLRHGRSTTGRPTCAGTCATPTPPRRAARSRPRTSTSMERC